MTLKILVLKVGKLNNYFRYLEKNKLQKISQNYIIVLYINIKERQKCKHARIFFQLFIYYHFEKKKHFRNRFV